MNKEVDNSIQQLGKWTASEVLDAFAKKCGAERCIVEIQHAEICYVEFDYGGGEVVLISQRKEGKASTPVLMWTPDFLKATCKKLSEYFDRVLSFYFAGDEEMKLKEHCLNKILEIAEINDIYAKKRYSAEPPHLVIAGGSTIEEVIIELELGGWLA